MVRTIKGIKKPITTKLINFQKNRIGIKLLEEPNENGINIISKYSGINEERVVFKKETG